MEIYGSVKLLGSLASGTGDDILTRDPSSKEVGTTTNALGTLPSAQIFVGNGSNVATAVAVSGDISISNAGVVAIASGVIVNADINASAAIAHSKMAALTASRALASDGSGVVSVTSITSTELGYVSGVTSAIQTQLNAKEATITGGATTITSLDLTANRALLSNSSGKVAVSSVTNTELGYVSGVTSNIQTQLNTKLAPTITSVATGDILYYNGSAWVNLARGTNGQTLQSTAGSIQWGTPTINGIPSGGTTGQYLRKSSGTDFDAAWDTFTTSDITDITASAAELNILDGAIIDVNEINFLNNVSSNIQTQLDNKLSTSLTTDNILKGVAGVATASTDLPTGITIGGANIYRVGGSDVTLADGGTGASLADPNADRIMFWDDSAGQVTWLSTGSDLSISGTTINVASGSFWKTAGTTTLTDNVTINGDYEIGFYNRFFFDGFNDPTTPTLSIVNSFGETLQIRQNGLVFTANSSIEALSQLSITGFSGVSITSDGQPFTLTLGSDATGDIYRRNSSGNIQRLALGAASHVLRVNSGGTDIEWASSGISGLTAGRVPFAASATSLDDDSQLVWDDLDKFLTVGNARIKAETTNTFFGLAAGVLSHSGASYNVGIGSGAINELTTGSQNVAVGVGSGGGITTGSNNTAIGDNALAAIVGGSGNTAVGTDALTGATGNSNIGIGHDAGDNITTGSNNIVIGTAIDAQSGSASNQLSIQNAIFGSANSATGTTISSGNLGLFATSWGTSAAKVIALGNGTAPSTSPADSIQFWSEDISSSAVPHFRNEAGQIIKLYQPNAGSAYSVSNGSTDRTYDANSTTLDELADILYTLITDLKSVGVIA
jgi:hypothetical protein